MVSAHLRTCFPVFVRIQIGGDGPTAADQALVFNFCMICIHYPRRLVSAWEKNSAERCQKKEHGIVGGRFLIAFVHRTVWNMSHLKHLFARLTFEA